MKECTKCHQTKPLEDFRVELRTKSGRQSRCRDCERSYRNPNAAELYKKYSLKAKALTKERKAAKIQDQLSRWANGETITCTICKTDKLVNDFVQDPRSIFGIRKRCKTCEVARVLSYKFQDGNNP